MTFTNYKDIVLPANLMTVNAVDAVSRAFVNMTEQNEELWANNRQMLHDFFNSEQHDLDEYLKAYFNGNVDVNTGKKIDAAKDDDYPHNLILSQVNFTAKIIDKKAKVYKTQPIRRIDGNINKDYTELLSKAGFKSSSKTMDRFTWLMGDQCMAIVADVNAKKLRFDIPPWYRPIFGPLDKKNPIGVAYPVGMVQNNDGEMVEGWQYWDAENSVLFENQTWNIIKQEPNPHGCFNVVFTHRLKPTASHWTRDAQDLVDTNRDINVALTSINNAIRYKGFPALAAIGVKQEDAANIKIRYDKIICIEGSDVLKQQMDIKVLEQTVDWTGLIDTIKARIEMLSMTWNVDIRWDMSGDIASGVALKILSIDNTDDLVDMQELYEEYLEEPLWEKLKVMSTKIEWLKVPQGKELTIDWAEQEFTETPTERQTRLSTDLQNNLTNPIAILMEENPDLDEVEAAKQYLKNIKINTALKKAPDSSNSILDALKEPTTDELNALLESVNPTPKDNNAGPAKGGSFNQEPSSTTPA